MSRKASFFLSLKSIAFFFSPLRLTWIELKRKLKGNILLQVYDDDDSDSGDDDGDDDDDDDDGDGDAAT